MREFKISPIRMLPYLAEPLLIVGVLAFFIYSVKPAEPGWHNNAFTVYWIVVCAVFFIPSVWLLLNHCLTLKQAVLRYDPDEKKYTYELNGFTYCFFSADIESVTVFQNQYARIDWSGVWFAEIKTKEKLLRVAPVLIHKSALKTIFPDLQVQHTFVFFPLLRKLSERKK